jgi:negative regulator of replication initiation
MVACGHIVYLGHEQMLELQRNHKLFYCTFCGNTNHYPGESKEEALKRLLASKEDQLATMRVDRDRKEAQRRAEKAAKTKIKQRVAHGVCPCCTRSFSDLKRHMTTKHPDYANSEAV